MYEILILKKNSIFPVFGQIIYSFVSITGVPPAEPATDSTRVLTSEVTSTEQDKPGEESQEGKTTVIGQDESLSSVIPEVSSETQGIEQQSLPKEPISNSDTQQVHSTEQIADIPQPTPVEETNSGPSSPPISKGNYNIDFDSIDLENFNPFGTKSKVSQDIPADSIPADCADTKVPLTEEAHEVPIPVTQELNAAVPEVNESIKEVPQSLEQEIVENKKNSSPQKEESAKIVEPSCEKTNEEVLLEKSPSNTQGLSAEPSANQETPSSPPLVPKGSYNIDFDSIDLESLDPFGTKSKVSSDVDSLPVSAKPVESSTVPPATQDKPENIKTSPKKPSPKKVSPKKASPKVSPKKKPEEEDESPETSFHDAVEVIPLSPPRPSQQNSTETQVC